MGLNRSATIFAARGIARPTFAGNRLSISLDSDQETPGREERPVGLIAFIDASPGRRESTGFPGD